MQNIIRKCAEKNGLQSLQLTRGDYISRLTIPTVCPTEIIDRANNQSAARGSRTYI